MSDNRNNYRVIFILVGSIVTAIVAMIAYIAYLSVTTAPTDETIIPLTAETEYTGIRQLAPQQMPDFTLTDQHNEAIALRDLRGKPTLITFGFTHCPDICPLTLGEMRQIRADLGATGDDLNYVFISVDGSRDTPDMLSGYFGALRIDSFMIGMTGASERVREIGRDYGVDFFYGTAGESGHYNVDHTAGMFLLDADNNWIRRYAYGTDRADIVQDLRGVIADT